MAKLVKIVKYDCNLEREPLIAPFGFKGGYLGEIWQVVVSLSDDAGNRGVGLGIQSVLWSDADVFVNNPESSGNSMMFLVTSYALKKAVGLEWETPIDLIDQLLPSTYDYAKVVTGKPDLRLTFALNALVPVDNAAWLLYCRAKEISHFDDMIPDDVKPALCIRHDKLAAIPLISYGVDNAGILDEIERGSFFLKIKIGCDPDKDGDFDKMLEWDKKRLSEIHESVKDIETPYTENGRIPYYLDANGRYDSKERLMAFITHAKEIGALDRIAIIEEPFPEEFKENVADIPVRLAADESAHSDNDAAERIELGYGAIALKPIAKTMSMSLKIAKLAQKKNIPCFCADLTVNPIMVDWNKCVAARLKAIPGLKVGVVESNGHQNYKNWETLKSYHPCYESSWMKPQNGLFELTDDFYERSGGIFLDSDHYSSLVK